jgi:predicted RND superfamily exporter protein
VRRLILWSHKHPWLIIILLLCVTILAGTQAFKIRIDSSARGMMIEDDPALDYYHETLKKFGTDNVTVIYVKDKKLFTPDKLKILEDLHYTLEELPGVDKAESLFTVTNFKSVDGFLETNPLIDWIPETQEEAEAVRIDALRNPTLKDNIISRDGTVTAINLFINTHHNNDPAFEVNFTKKADKILSQYKDKFDNVFQLGMSYTRKQIIDSILSDQITLVPLSVLVLMLTLILSMRSASGAALPLLTAGTSVVWTAGFMGYIGIPLNVLTVIVPSLIIVIGSTEDIHILSEYMEGMTHKGIKDLAIKYMAGKVGTAVLLTALTTFLGFLSITVNKITILKQFGIVASFGLFVNPLITCLLAPVYLHFFGPKVKKDKTEKENKPKPNYFDLLANKIINLIRTHKRLVLTGLLSLAALIGLFSAKVKVDNDMLGYFKPDSSIRQRSKILHQELAGAQTFFIRITSGLPGTFKQPEYLKQIARLQEFINSTGKFDKTLSLADYISLIHKEMNNGDKNFYKIPDSHNLISQYLLLLHRDTISRYVTPDYSEANILVRHNLSSSHELNSILEKLKKESSKIINSHFHIGFTGENILINAAADTMASGQAQSLSFLLIVIFLIMSILFVNMKAGALSLIPNLFPIAIIFGIMGIFDIPLNTGTAMVAAIAIGIAVDDTIHFMARYNEEMRRLQNQNLAMEVCLRSEIRPVLATSIALSLGFAILGFSHFVPVIYFGLLSALVMLFALLGDLFITPILLSSTQLITLWDMLGLKLKKAVIFHSPLFRDMKAWQIKKIVLLGKVVEKKQNEPAVVQGEPGSSMFLILEGEARVVSRDKNGQEVKLATLKPGEIFGEIALIKPGPRSADVLASTDLKYLEIDWNALQRIQKIYPRIASRLFLNLSRILGQRLLMTNKKLLECTT